MSTKELYEAHALIIKNKRVDQSAYSVVDEAIEHYIQAERHLRQILEASAASQKKDVDQIYRERFKSVICREVQHPYKDAPVLPDGNELQQLHFLANHYGCPQAVWPVVSKK